MRKRIINRTAAAAAVQPEAWINIESTADVEVTSEDERHPIESAFRFGQEEGWRAREPGRQTIRMFFDPPRPIRRIWLQFVEAEQERTQQFTLRWSPDGQVFHEIVRQQWNFSPSGSTIQTEDYRVDLKNVSVIEVTIDPDMNRGDTIASIADWRIA